VRWELHVRQQAIVAHRIHVVMQVTMATLQTDVVDKSQQLGVRWFQEHMVRDVAADITVLTPIQQKRKPCAMFFLPSNNVPFNDRLFNLKKLSFAFPFLSCISFSIIFFQIIQSKNNKIDSQLCNFVSRERIISTYQNQVLL
jgi:hypothetical protein